MNENTKHSKSEVVSDVLNISGNQSVDNVPTPASVIPDVHRNAQDNGALVTPSVSDTNDVLDDTITHNYTIQHDNLGEPLGLLTPIGSNLCYLNSALQLLAASFPEEIGQQLAGKYNENTRQCRLHKVVQYINRKTTDNQNTMSEYVQDIAREINPHESGYGANVLTVLKQLIAMLQFLPQKTLFKCHTICYYTVSSGNIACYDHNGVTSVLQDEGIVDLPSVYQPRVSDTYVYDSCCFKKRVLFCSHCDISTINHNYPEALSVWRDVYNNVVSSADPLEQIDKSTSTVLAKKIVDAYVDNAKKYSNLENLDTKQNYPNISFYYI